MLKGLWTGCFLLAVLFSLLALASAGSANPNGIAYEENRNIFLKADDKTTQLTDTGKDSEPILSPNGKWVAFNREIEGKVKECSVGEGNVARTCATDQLWILDLKNQSERMLVEPREEADDTNQIISNFFNKTFSPDGKTLFFNTTIWEDVLRHGTAVHAVDVDGENERFVAYGSDLQIINRTSTSTWNGFLVLVKWEQFLGGLPYSMIWLVTPEGKEIAPLAFGEDKHFSKSYLSLEFMENDGAYARKKLEADVEEKKPPTASVFPEKLNLDYGVNNIDINADGIDDIIVKVRWNNGNAHSFDKYLIAVNTVYGEILEVPLGDGANYGFRTFEAAECMLEDFSFRKDERGWLEVTQFRRDLGKTSIMDPTRVDIITYKLFEFEMPIPGFPHFYLKVANKHTTKEKYCDVKKLMK